MSKKDGIARSSVYLVIIKGSQLSISRIQLDPSYITKYGSKLDAHKVLRNRGNNVMNKTSITDFDVTPKLVNNLGVINLTVSVTE